MTVSRITLKEQQLDADVLVVGAGAGGMMAAITAADNGARVTLCEKGCARRSGGIPGGNDHFWCYIPGFHSPTYRTHAIKDLMTGGITDEDMIVDYVDSTYTALQKWESWGINMKINGHYEFVGHSWPGSSGEPGKNDRPQLHFSDPSASVKLEKQVKDRGIRIINRVMVTELLKDATGHVAGAMGISTREPTLYAFKAKSIVINKGGVSPGRIYPPPNVIGYSMAEFETGDGVMMAYRAGADLQNAEFFRRQISLRFGPRSGKGTWVGVTRDSEGRPIAPPYLTKPDVELGDKAIENAAAVDHAWETGKGPVWMDPRGISEKDERYMRWGFESEALLPFLRWLDREKIDVKKTRFEFIGMQPGTHVQARVNTRYETSVRGLYMILPGGLSRSAVSGMIAGEAAAKDIKGIQTSNLADHRNTLLHFKEQYEEILHREGSQFADWREAQWAIYQIMHCYALPPHRTENTLLAGYNQLLRLRETAKRGLRGNNPHDLYHCLEVLNLIDIVELVLLAVRERKESRGQAQRQDYPFMNPMLNKFLVITQKDGKPIFRWEKPRRVSE
jgi:succinate dehydrogenase/fumarate reductase flavoprotein subunit